MFTIDATIDAVQNSKKQFINTFVINKPIAEALTSFVDAQAKYTKAAAKTGLDTVTVLAQEVQKTWQESSKFDYTKFGEGIMKAYNATKL